MNQMKNLYNGFSCVNCSDGFSYPEKFFVALFNQLKIKYDYQYSPIWANKKRYDFHINGIIVEVNGEQHYTEVTNFKSSLSDIEANDIYKEQLALNNGIKYYLQIDCSKSDFTYIKNSIIN